MRLAAKVTLRALEPRDLELLYDIENNQENWRVSSNNLPFSKDALNRYIDNAQQDIFEARQFRFVVDHEGICVGLVDVFDFDPISLKAGVGIFILESERRKGYAYEAIELLKINSKNNWQIHQLYAHIGSDNLASIELFKNAGFEKVGLLKD